VRVAFFTDGPEGPGSRFRCLQLFPALQARGIECTAHFAYDERYNEVFQRSWAPAYKLSARLKRVTHLLLDTGYDLVFLHKTALAFSGLPEYLRHLRHTPMVFDFDDAIHLSAAGKSNYFRRGTFQRVVSIVDHVIAGNAYLAEIAGVPHKTTIIPTVVDTTVHALRPPNTGQPLVIGWIGTASNFPHLVPVMPELLKAVEQIPDARLRIVSNAVMSTYENHPRVEHWRWQKARELQALHSFDIGLMPLSDTEQTRGKCGFKMLQYMAVGVPVVASAVGANLALFEGSRAGALVPPGGDWVEPILALAGSCELRLATGRAAREHVMTHYSVESVVEKYASIFRGLVKHPRR
jgi:glycosyltransferase involved in cell wall biosynthesis